MLRPTVTPSTSAVTTSAPAATSSDSRYTAVPATTSKRWILRYAASSSPSGPKRADVLYTRPATGDGS